jgi:hypothetical protein
MTWTYTQLHGQAIHNGQIVGIGYSGYHEGKNNPDMEAVHAVGPIPRGHWRIVRWDDHHGDKGPQVAVLEPVGHNAHGRTEFLIHGDSASHPGEASHGCIIMARPIRDQWRASGDMDIEVTA